jgi:hypothetical protein
LEFDSRPTTLLCKEFIVAKFKEVKTGSILAESSKEYYGSKKDCFANYDDDKIYVIIILNLLMLNILDEI